VRSFWNSPKNCDIIGMVGTCSNSVLRESGYAPGGRSTASTFKVTLKRFSPGTVIATSLTEGGKVPISSERSTSTREIHRCLLPFISLMPSAIFREVRSLKIKYSKDADILLIELREGYPADSVDLKEGVILHLDAQGFPLEIEILDASRLTSLEEIQIITPFEATHR